jgi:hypothetical protein
MILACPVLRSSVGSRRCRSPRTDEVFGTHSAAEQRCGSLFGGQWRELTVIVRRIHRQDGGHVWAVVTQRAGCGGSSPWGDLDQMPIRTRCSPTSTSPGRSERRSESMDQVDHDRVHGSYGDRREGEDSPCARRG